MERSGTPPLPSLQLEGMSPEARATLGRARNHAVGNQQDAEANGSFGIALHAYELRDESIACYRRAAALAPRDWRWPYYLGSVHAELGGHAEAARHLRKAVSLAPDSVAARIRLGDSLLGDGRPTESRRVFEGAVALDPSSARSHYGLGRACDSEGDTVAALRAYMRAIDLAPEAGAVRYAMAMLYRGLGRQSDSSRQMELIEDGNRLAPPMSDPLMAAVHGLRTDKHERLQEGLRFERSGLLADAVRAYQEAVEADSGYPQPHVNLVAAYGRLGRFEDAERHYERGLELDPDSEELHVNWGTLLAGRNLLPEAARSFRRALEINPLAANTHAELGWVLDQSGQASEAIAHFRLALEYESGHRSANFHMARYLIGEDRVHEAIRHLLKTREPVDDRTPTYLYGLADAYLRIDELGQAVRYARQARERAIEMGQSDLAREVERDLRALEAAIGP